MKEDGHEKAPEMSQVVTARPLNDAGDILYLTHVFDGKAERIGTVTISFRQGVAKDLPEDVRCACSVLMVDHQLDRILSEVDVSDEPSRSLMKQVGFHEIGISRENKDGRGGRRDVVWLEALPRYLETVNRSKGEN